jgi:coproporphyrinogen III oxidase-like Fe-S oxidoreductase
VIPFESFSYPLFDLNYDADAPALVASFLDAPARETVATQGLRGLYIHIPFCETICEFCPFIKGVGSPVQISRYLDALLAELELLGQKARLQQWKLDAVYVGGGTPSVLTEDQFASLFARVRASFTLAPNAEVSVEVEPKSATAAKLDALKELAVTRVSFGVQTFDPQIREAVNLTASLDDVYRTIELATSRFTDTNFDLMVGFPGQTADAVRHEMQLAISSGIGSISVYPVDYVMTLPTWLDKIRRGELPKPAPIAERSGMFHAARAELAREMSEQNMYCFGSADAPPTKYMFSILYGGYHDQCVGAGTGAYSFLSGLAYYNNTSLREYVDCLAAGRLPVAAASPGQAYEKGIVFFPKRLSLDSAELDRTGLRELYEPRLRDLAERGLIDDTGHVVSLTEQGKLVYSELMVAMFSESQRRLYSRICQRLRQQVGVIDDTDWQAGADRIRALGAVSAMTREAGRQRRAA